MAAPQVDFQVQGLAGLERNMLQLANDYGPRNARRAFNIPMRDAFRLVENAIRVNTPIDTGRLRETVLLQSTTANVFERADSPNAIWSVRAGWFWTSPSTFSFQTLAVEYGTRFVPAQRTLRNALESNASAVLDQFGRELGANIERTADRLGRRQRQQGADFRRR